VREFDDELGTLTLAFGLGPNLTTETFNDLFGDIETETSARNVGLTGIIGADKFIEKFLKSGWFNSHSIISNS
jgi:hypothetical protein